MYQRRSLNLALWLVALCALCAYGQASAQNKWAGTVKVRVDSVLATDTHEKIDARLPSAMILRFRSLFDFTAYQLVRREEQHIKCGRMISFSLPGGRILRVAPQSINGGMIAMELVLFDGARPVMTTDLKLMNHGILIVGGPRYQQGMLLTIIATDTNDAPAEATHDAPAEATHDAAPPLAQPSLGPAIPATAPNAANLPQ
jgi:hypothetical protein